MAVFLSALLVYLGASSIFRAVPGERGILGGPDVISSAQAMEAVLVETPALGGDSAPLNIMREGGIMETGANFLADAELAASLDDPGEALGPSLYRSEPVIYKVESGDNLTRIASYFGVSLDTILSANPGLKSDFLKVGDELSILPTSGVVYRVKAGDSLESISTYFNVPEAKIAEFNRSINFSELEPGETLIIPGARNFSLAYLQQGSLPDLGSYFAKPADGYNWGRLHHYNAVDIANVCGTPIYAAAEGLVVPDGSFGSGVGGWNGGYGKFVLIEHPFGDGIRTRYAHLEEQLASIGDYVKQGQEVGLMGDTGDATGCHLHFEVYGAENPFAKY